MLLPKFVSQPVHNALGEVFTAKVGIAISAFYFEDAIT
jgi:RNase P/RNase MRP subunit POP5